MHGTLKRAAFDLLEMPQVIVFLLKVVLQETWNSVSSGAGLGNGRGILKKVLLCCSCELLDCKHLFLNCIIRIS